ncbi:hypothetical protein [Cohaesibacter marisflavi]|uniref:hypothetical protein n=1 Tax=Cohaesibacter marisflavi TaxID=655353 RepID=UPI0029C915DD|nr:hypothetical protein [Cohaesibacter marisflavi]
MDEDWISITDAAKRLTKAGDAVTRSTLSRYLDKHSDALPTKKDGRSNLVDYVVLRQHRKENIRIDVASASQAMPQGEGVPDAAAGAPPSGKSSSNFQGSRVDGASRKAQAEAELKEMDLAERRAQLTPTGEVDRAGRDAVALMRSAFERSVEGEAAMLSVKYGWDERTVRLALKGFARVGLDAFHRVLLKRVDQLSRKPLDGDTEQEAEIEAETKGGSIEDVEP